MTAAAIVLGYVLLLGLAGRVGYVRGLREARWALVPVSRPWPDTLKPFMEEAQREVDAMFPDTPAIAAVGPWKATAEEVQRANTTQATLANLSRNYLAQNATLLRQMDAQGQQTIAQVQRLESAHMLRSAALPPDLYVDPTTMEVVDQDGWRAPFEAWQGREAGRPVVFKKPRHSDRTRAWHA